jgi:hypothetical protein
MATWHSILEVRRFFVFPPLLNEELEDLRHKSIAINNIPHETGFGEQIFRSGCH